ncbi:MAG: toprim domain-containing protein [bacterium]
MDSIQKLTEIFSRFPGIGPRQAKRFVYHLLNQNEYSNKQIADLILDLKKETTSCFKCKRFFNNNRHDIQVCHICVSPNRDKSKLMVVAKDVDLENIERSNGYNGMYFVLGGLLQILEKTPLSKIKQEELLKEIETTPELKEIIIALSANTEGDHTTDYLKQVLENISTTRQIKISVLGRGLSTGTELEYSDSDTIKNALKNRE